MYKNFDIWDHFENIVQYKALCKYCQNKYVHSGVTHNLLQHLFTKHIDKMGIGEKYSKLPCSVLWEYFTKVGEDKMAMCNFCDKLLSYKTTVTNLKVHLSRSHTESFLRLLQNLPPAEKIDHNDSAATVNDEDSNESDQLAPDIWNFFEQETGGRARCVVCRTSRPNNVEDLRNHLAEKHPKLLTGTSQETVVSEESGDEDSGNYTEVIYVEEDTKGKPSKYYVKEPKHSSRRKEHRPKKEHKQKNGERDRRLSASSDDLPIKRRRTEERNEPDQIDSFLTYIKCLLRQVIYYYF
ncbi:hypothetical protein O3G_MSEX013727 [Manduca sexta]|uniref:BED-type domain-containing protein n=1 Tax=Manduca sexta TaxID=7130 RepID=A0A921ZSR8_MANSE|nr:hypothetical protein O3G_MSEX013727 [Manduca sexta]